jgi:hypothetical protein
MKTEIELGANGVGTVKLDDIDLAPFLSGFSLTANANTHGPARLYLDVAVPQNIHFVGEVEIELAPDLERALVHMGWTPPKGGAA